MKASNSRGLNFMACLARTLESSRSVLICGICMTIRIKHRLPESVEGDWVFLVRWYSCSFKISVILQVLDVGWLRVMILPTSMTWRIGPCRNQGFGVTGDDILREMRNRE